MPPGKQKRPRGRPRKANNAFGKWIDAQGMTAEAAARKLGISESYVDKLARSERRPDLELALKIERLSRGAVPASAWLKSPKHSGD
jgi:transcriptional regulator with XRE-family HTH domain